MYRFEDYLDLSEDSKPYASAKEHMDDCLAFFEMILERFIEVRSDEPGMHYTPGIIMTDEQAQNFYGTRPVDRSGNLYDEEASLEVSKARSYIFSRERATESYLPIRTVREEFKLSLFEELALFISLDLAVNINLRNLYAYMGNDALIKQPTAGMLYSLYDLISPYADVSLLNDLCDPCGKMAVFFLRLTDNAYDVSSLMDMPIALRGDMLAFLLGAAGHDTYTAPDADTKTGPDSIPYTSSYDEPPVDIDIFADVIASLPSDDEGSFVYISSRDGGDVLKLLAKRKGTGFPVLNAGRLFKDLGKKGNRSSEGLIPRSIGAYLSYIRLTGALPVVKLDEKDDPDESSRLLDVLKKYLPNRTIYIYGSENMPQGLEQGSEIYPVKLNYPDVDAREKLWEHYLKETGLKISDEISIPDLADCYELSVSDIRQVVWRTSGQVRWRNGDIVTKADLKEHLFALGERELSSLATYIPSSFTWDDLQIEPAQREVLMVACERFRHRNRIDRKLGTTRKAAYGNGVSVLLSGSPGTGKTMAAQVVSEELQLPLYRIDVSQIYSKYIGETQKNLGEVFDRAQKTNAILFFDEADALFSKRTEVTDSHDKYANADTAYLLQKIEAHRGMVLLATNLFQNIDAAFVRRLTYVVRLNRPDEAVRLSLWKSILPSTVKLAEDIDFEFFAENFDISGSNIKSILYSAMYMAESAGRELSNREIVLAMKYDSDKSGIYNDPSQFGRYASYLYE